MKRWCAFQYYLEDYYVFGLRRITRQGMCVDFKRYGKASWSILKFYRNKLLNLVKRWLLYIFGIWVVSYKQVLSKRGICLVWSILSSFWIYIERFVTSFPPLFLIVFVNDPHHVIYVKVWWWASITIWKLRNILEKHVLVRNFLKCF